MSENVPESAIRFATTLKQIAQEFDMDVAYPDDPRRIYIIFSERSLDTKELQEKINARIRELEGHT